MSKVSARVKFVYGLGSVGEGLFSRGYEAFAFVYFVQVLGMSATLGGLAMLVSTLLDAVTDPLVGSVSDNWKSRFGRRHPFMYASAVPFALTWFLLLMPPQGLDQIGLFLWFTTFSVLLRQSLTLYHVPHLAMGAELTNDYLERTSVVTWRIALGFAGSFGAVALFTALFFPETAEYPENGLLNPDGYPQVALWGSLLMLASIGYSAWGTRDRIPYMPTAPEIPQRFSARRVWEEAKLAWGNRSFRALFIGSLLFVTSFGINEVFNPFLYIYFWGLTSGQIAALFLPVGLGFFAALPLAKLLHHRFDKKPTVIVASLVPAGLSGGLVILKLLGALPDSATVVFGMLAVAGLIRGACGGVAFISGSSMMADVAQEIVHSSGQNVTGLLFSGISFAQKCSSAVSHALAGVALDLVRIPPGTQPGDVAPELIQLLGLASLVALFFALGGIASYFGYGIDRSRFSELSPLAPAATGGAPPPEPGPGSVEELERRLAGGAPSVTREPSLRPRRVSR